MLRLFVVLSLLALGALANAATQVESQYTSVKIADCVIIDSETLYPEAPIDFLEAECGGLGGYRVIVSGGDIRYDLSLIYDGKTIELDKPEGFHDMGAEKIEWRYVRSGKDFEKVVRYTALIYRVSYQEVTEDGEGRDTEKLVVVRLDGKKTCVIGEVPKSPNMNGQARAIADDPSRPCRK